MPAALCVFFLIALGTVQSNEDAAQSAAESWLATVDGGDYGASWDASASMFRAAVTREDWERAAAATRGPLGALVSRKLQSRAYMTSLPGAPDGEYVVLQFETVFENKRSAVETVTPMRDEDGTWRVSGYYVR